jgi:beta-N-acetylhexosaminidase
LEIPRFIHEEDTVVISLNNPYHLQDVPRVSAYINTYTATRVNLELALEKMCGQGTFQGTSPVDAFCGLYDTRL